MKTFLQKLLIRWCHVNDKPLPDWLARACERTPALAKERDVEGALSRRLRSDVRPAQSGASPYLAQRVAGAIREIPKARESSKWSILPQITWVAAACVVALVAVRLDFLGGRKVMTPDLETRQTAVVSTSASLPEPQVASPSAGIPGWVNPLDQEVEDVIADARGALHFLATSFLPTGAGQNTSG
ncbi:MAG: hypothetical protein KBA71_14310 [Opitutaceae bacterium]|nr:hypothetical protein [Opitutaceae bacterium]